MQSEIKLYKLLYARYNSLQLCIPSPNLILAYRFVKRHEVWKMQNCIALAAALSTLELYNGNEYHFSMCEHIKRPHLKVPGDLTYCPDDLA